MAQTDKPLTLEEVPEGHWVVLTANHSRVVAHHPDLVRALAEAERSGVKDLVFIKAVSLGRYIIAFTRVA